jgi:hypothetical protein
MKNAWLRATIPLQGLLLLSQLVTGLNADRIPPRIYQVVHEGGGILLVVLVLIHVLINWGWIHKSYFKRTSGR